MLNYSTFLSAFSIRLAYSTIGHPKMQALAGRQANACIFGCPLGLRTFDFTDFYRLYIPTPVINLKMKLEIGHIMYWAKNITKTMKMSQFCSK